MKGYISIKISTLRKISLALLSLIALGTAGYLLKCHYADDVPYVETKSYYELRADGRTVLYFRSADRDSMLNGMSLSPLSVDYAGNIPVSQSNLYEMVEKNRNAINHRISQLDSIRQELYYYLERHSVQDEGFDMVAERVTVLVNEMTKLEKWRDALASIDATTHLYTKKVVTRQRIDSISPSPIFVGIDGGIWTRGRWIRTERSGKGVSFDYSGRPVAGIWNADTMASGTRYDLQGVYRGQTDRWMQASGHGTYQYADCTYEGHFDNDREEGFGVAVSTLKLRAGEWKGGKFKGERMQYTSERIYGIDISKYQHGKGRKRYPIHWGALRITSLGHISNKRANGKVDYPVSFVYIKSTEGTTIRNQYYASDYAQARKHGVKVGAYHFFSTRTSGAMQAKFFLKNSRFRSGDLPPVLDVEPTAAQIKSMGGVDVMFRNIRQWLKAVQSATGVKPVLYVGQSFVNKYLDSAPDIKKNYNVWIARYGEFKPDVKLLYWQLSPYGRVNGIHGEVDINVFNGYRSQFDVFVQQNCIR